MPVKTDTFALISNEDLVTVSGGAGAAPASFDAYVTGERDRIKPIYKSVVCAGAGVKGGQALANGLYGGKDGAAAPTGEQIRAAKFLSDFCNAGETLPSAAPASPF